MTLGVAAELVQIRLNPRRIWRWHLWLVEYLTTSLRRSPKIVLSANGPVLASSVATLLSLERLVYRIQGQRACDLLTLSDIPSSILVYDQDSPATLCSNITVLDLSGENSPATSTHWLMPAFDGAPAEDVLIGALLSGIVPKLTIIDASRRDLTWIAAPAVENPRVLTRALDNVFSTLFRLCRKALDEACLDRSEVSGNAGAQTPHRHEARPSWPILRFAISSISASATARLTKLCARGPRWFVGWRWATEDRLHCTHELPPSGYMRLLDEPHRFYADPFGIRVQGRHYVFCEDFDYRLGRGVISMTVIDGNVPPRRPTVVLERPYHLSYPFVFAANEQIWMIPETAAAEGIELYRADPFPDRWVLEGVLLRNVRAADATLLRDKGRWWIFAATSEHQSSSWDALSLFHAPDLLGPWTPHRRNPVLIDRSMARPGGALFTCRGALWRPAQNCSQGYGRGLTLCSVERLDEEDFVQSVKGIISPSPLWGPVGLHTINWVDGLELVDGLG